MSSETKDAISRWSPLIVSIITYLVIIGFTYGKLDQRIVPLEQHVAYDSTENQIKMFVTRAEWTQRNETRDREMSEMKSALHDINNKLDRLIEHEINAKK